MDQRKESGTLSLAHEANGYTILSRATRGNQFSNRNCKPLIIYAVIFLGIGILCHILLKNAQESSRQEIYDSGVLSAKTIAEKVTVPLLEKDVLTLNVAMGELEKKHRPVLASILDHDDNIIAHSDPDEIGKTYTEPEDNINIRTEKTVSIDRVTIEGRSVICFSKALVFSNVTIGKILFGIDATQLDQTISGYGRLIFIIWGICAVCFITAVFLTDLYLKDKQQKALEEIERTRKVGPYLLTPQIAQGGMAERYLAEILAHEKQGLSVGMATFIIQKITLCLDYSHTKTNDDTGEPLNIVHRDVSTQNMLISFKGEVKISDFGISKARSEPSLTQAGVIKGKLSYLAPKQALGKEADHQSDLYALGIIFYEILSGKRLYKFENEIAALSNLHRIVIPPINTVRTDIPDELNRIVMKCLDKDPRQRYESGKRIYDDLAQFRKNQNILFDETNLIDFMAKRFK